MEDYGAIHNAIRLVRPLCIVVLTGVVCYLAIRDVEGAREVVFTTFTVLAGHMYGERSALKVPGKSDN